MLDRPAPIMTSDPGSFARHTILQRLPAIIDRVLAGNDYAELQRRRLLALRDEVAGGWRLGRLSQATPDRAAWDAACALWEGRTWLGIPWFFAEAYFYRRLLEAVGYFDAGPTAGQDPFRSQKLAELGDAALDGLAGVLGRLPAAPAERCAALLLCALWGNRADLTFDGMAQTAYAGLESGHAGGLLIDQRAVACEKLAGGLRRVDFINDNAGLELLFDLALADFLLKYGMAGQVHFHLKSQPFFVSDAMIADVHDALERVRSRRDLAALGRRLADALAGGRLALHAQPFWVMPAGFEALPADLRADLAQADMVILKGDANYRRLLDDRHWPATASLAVLTSYFPAPYVAIRAIKAELIVDLSEDVVRRLHVADPQWMVNGQYGLIRVVEPPASRNTGGRA